MKEEDDGLHIYFDVFISNAVRDRKDENGTWSLSDLFMHVSMKNENNKWLINYQESFQSDAADFDRLYHVYTSPIDSYSNPEYYELTE